MTVRQERRGGFTLIESLAALAITSLVVLSCGALLRESGYFFDRGTRAIDETERFARAVNRLRRDFASVRFVPEAGGKAAAAAFIGQSEKVVFIAPGREASTGEEVVEYAVEPIDGGEGLVRRRARWPGPSSRLSDIEPQDPVVLLRGSFSISFVYAQPAPDGALVWRDEWTGADGLPQAVRVKLIDSATGADFLAADQFLIRANAPLTCASSKENCLPGQKETASATRQQPQQSEAR
jgi:prepilin-type N-terminal cleavage/methylation domain-containing protein